MSDWQPTIDVNRLKLRGQIQRAIRDSFYARSFIEVETPFLSRETVIDEHIDPIVVTMAGQGEFILQTSPEAHMKRLLAGGAERIFQFSHAFRAGEVGRKHNPEFTMLEWYARDWSLSAQMELITEFIVAAIERLSEVGAECFDKNRLIEQLNDCVRIRYDDLFLKILGVSTLSLTPQQSRRMCLEHGLAIPAEMSEDHLDDWLNLLWVHLIEPHLSEMGAVIVSDYPASMAALAELSEEDPRFAQRFELYLDGLEICNGYQELRDAEELSRRMESQQRQRMLSGKRRLNPPSLLMAAQVHGLPACSGVALGFDRLMMWLLGVDEISKVMSFDWSNA